MQPEPKTMKEMCETIAFYHLQRTGKVVRPEDIYNSSPTGELFQVIDMYNVVTGAVLDWKTLQYSWPDTFDNWKVPE